MIGYWLVLALVACALAAVVAASVDDARSPSSGRRSVVAILGASDALGEGTPDPARDGWVGRLAVGLPRDVVIRNLAVGGSSLAAARRDQLPAVLSAAPDVAVCWLVVNDLITGVDLTSYERDLDAVLAELAGAGSAVIVGNVPDLGRLPFLAGSSQKAEEARRAAIRWNAAIGRGATARGAHLVDLFDESIAPTDFGPDGFHPSPAGHAKLAARFLPPVKRLLPPA